MLNVKIDKGDRIDLYLQVAGEIRRAIADGEAKPGERLPPAKDLAAVLEVNTNTVLRSLRVLRDEGLLEFRRGRGISVAGTPNVVSSYSGRRSSSISPATTATAWTSSWRSSKTWAEPGASLWRHSRTLAQPNVLSRAAPPPHCNVPDVTKYSRTVRWLSRLAVLRFGLCDRVRHDRCGCRSD